MPTTVADQTAPTLDAAIRFISEQSSEEDLDRIRAAVKRRNGALQEARAALVTTGSTVRIKNIRPKYMSGLTGKVTEIREGRSATKAVIELDSDSSTAARMSSTRFPLHGPIEIVVPASCCLPQ
ncbi:hypothetical protein [Streptomyces qinglanensis]|uniref:hypothetical protein n=1 Tax=Streptomyces qinglanensis TaxID=943816 RepID=UPI003D70E7A2